MSHVTITGFLELFNHHFLGRFIETCKTAVQFGGDDSSKPERKFQTC